MTASEDLAVIGMALWAAVNDPDSAYARQMRDRMATPQLGDVVVRVTVPRAGRGFNTDGLGRLAALEDGDWVIEPYDRPHLAHIWIGQEFIALPLHGTGWPDPTAS